MSSDRTDIELGVAPSKVDAEVTSTAVQETSGSKERTWRQKAAAVLWDSFDKSPEERKFIAKVDWWILSYCCVAYFVKYLDQTNINNAYVSGMEEDLDMHGNQLNYLNTYWTIGK